MKRSAEARISFYIQASCLCPQGVNLLDAWGCSRWLVEPFGWCEMLWLLTTEHTHNHSPSLLCLLLILPQVDNRPKHWPFVLCFTHTFFTWHTLWLFYVYILFWFVGLHFRHTSNKDRQILLYNNQLIVMFWEIQWPHKSWESNHKPFQ